MLDRIITYSFYTLFFLTPLFFTKFNNELFEYNKMMLVYGLTVVIVAAWIIKMVRTKSVLIKRTPLDIPILLFLASQILSTIFSIDPHTSIWGYYSRSNGGLLSIITYISLYYALVSNLAKEQVIKLLKVALAGGFLVALWAVFEHFGHSFSCWALEGSFDDNCWVQDVQSRVFASLGQPNWLAAYLEMLIFPAFYFFLTATKALQRWAYGIILVTFYAAFTFTYSRGATFGIIAGLVVFLGLLVFSRVKIIKLLTSILLLFLLVILFFGSALTRFNLIH